MELAQVVALVLIGTMVLLPSTAWRILLGWPSTVLHELSHWVVALAFGCRPSLPVLWPKKKGDEWVLGSVAFEPSAFATGWIALAPWWLLGSLAVATLSLPAAPLTLEILKGIIAGFGLWGSIPSRTDFELALKYPLGGLPALGLVSFATYLYVVSFW